MLPPCRPPPADRSKSLLAIVFFPLRDESSHARGAAVPCRKAEINHPLAIGTAFVMERHAQIGGQQLAAGLRPIGGGSLPLTVVIADELGDFGGPGDDDHIRRGDRHRRQRRLWRDHSVPFRL
jgi:hypothetical protein